MKLISCYIENFGGLSGYSLDFSSDITVIQEPNGFGKTTLAEFLRAMLYGFPRQSRDLDKNRRQKYTPWQGGSFGGSLVFEAGGRRYRVERTFGDVPRKDTFRLIDLATGLESRDYSENIGLELFELDGDSFERSTYLPQSHDLDGLTTDGIRAKLSDLVEDSGDIGNFEKAMQTLRARRTALKPLRGSGGSIGEANGQISQLQSKLAQLQQQEDQLHRTEQDIAGLEARLEEDRKAVEAARKEIREADQIRSRREIHSRYAELLARQEDTRAQVQALNDAHPGGFPSSEEAEAARNAQKQKELLTGQLEQTPQERMAAVLVSEQQERFSGGIPTPERLEQCRSACVEFCDAETRLGEKLRTAEDQQARFRELEEAQNAGLLAPDRLEELSRLSVELHRQKAELENAVLSPQERAALEALKRQFPMGAPEEGQLLRLEQKLSQAEQLHREAAYLERQAGESQKRSGGAGTILAVLLGAGAMVLGIVLLLRQQMLAGGAALTVGLACLIAGCARWIRQLVSRELSTGRVKAEEAAEKRRQAAALLHETKSYVNQYLPGEPSLQLLRQLEDQSRRFRELNDRWAELSARSDGLRQEISRTEQKLREALDGPDYDEKIADLRAKALRFTQLRQDMELLEVQIQQLRREKEIREEKIRAFLTPYFPEASPRDYNRLLNVLGQEIGAYRQALARTEECRERQARCREQIAVLEETLASFGERYSVVPKPDWETAIQQLREDGRHLTELQAQLTLRQRQAEAYFDENRDLLSQPLPEELPDLSALQSRETALERTLDDDSRQLLERKQYRDALRAQTDEIPAVRDALESWQRQKKTDTDNVRLLDDTMELLQKSRDHLSCQYLGPVGERFASYMHELMGEEQEHILVNTGLEVRLERQGKTRELDYFSTGQEDLVMLCMRFALVDALFTREQPFVILDDPFVNLDDLHTLQALEVLRKLSRQRQILYLTCHSSRSL